MSKNAFGEIEIINGDLNNNLHKTHLVKLLNTYMTDPMGNAVPFDVGKQKKLIEGLSSHPTAFILFAVCCEEYIGMVIGFKGFSTFNAMPLLNIHDIIVLPEYRNRGAGRILLKKVEEKAIKENCCKITLEVRIDNGKAMNLYEQSGFHNSEPPMYFWIKSIEQLTD